MTDREIVAGWMAGYTRAWDSNAPADIRALFTPDAEYRYRPTDDPRVGPDAITASWLDDADGAGDHTFSWEVVAVDGAAAVVQGRTEYLAGEAAGRVYANLWVIRFADDGRATSFTEWWMEPRESAEA